MYHDRYLKFRDELWENFEKLVRTGTIFQNMLGVSYPNGTNPPGLSVDTDGNSWFTAQAIERNPEYTLHRGEDIIVGTNKVIFIERKKDARPHEIEPDILDLYWLSELLDSAKET